MLNFLLPWSMVAGGVLISSPIIIHLINRMRFKRIRWAAMEFLLKSQKRNRRRLIIEQLILLLLRIILVLLAALLVARFVFAGMMEKKNTLHVVLLDDTPSMSDHWSEDGERRDTFSLAKRLIVEKIAQNTLKSNTPHGLKLILLSDVNNVATYERLNPEEINALRTKLNDTPCSAIHVDLLEGIQSAKAILDANPQDLRVLHIVSDFRQVDWNAAEGTESSKLTQALQGLTQGGVKLRLVDAAHPYRVKTVLYHDNLGITDLRPETRLAARAMPVQFEVTVNNFSNSEKKNVRVTIKVNGSERADASLTMPSVRANSAEKAKFTVYFEKTGFNQVTANLENEEAGLQMDNIRYAVVEVREQVPLLVIDGNAGDEGTRPTGDIYHLRKLFDKTDGSARGYDLQRQSPADLEKLHLDQFPSIYLVNVRELSDKAIQNLETYVREGGSVAFFMGDRINAAHYNDKLYVNGKGIFPAPLADRPNPPLTADEMKPEFSLDQNQIFLNDNCKTHPIFAEVYPSYQDGVFKFLPIKRYYPVARGRWTFDPDRVKELVTLPNRKSLDDYRDQTLALLKDIPVNEPGSERYRKRLEEHQANIRRVLTSGGPLYKLANAVDAMLRDEGDAKTPEERPNLTEFFAQPELRRLQQRLTQFRDEIRYGDPLVIASRYGNGKVVAFLTTAGQKWNHWAGGSMPYVMATYPIMMIEMQKYLTNLAEEINPAVGSPHTIQLDATRFDNELRIFRLPEPDPAKPAASNDPIFKDKLTVQPVKDRLTFEFKNAREPGVYLFEMTQKAVQGGAASSTEKRAFAFNVDTLAEGDLRRADEDGLKRTAGDDGTGSRVLIQGPDAAFDQDTNRQSDLSEMPWLFLIILLVLLAEQALAVHLSFHLRGSEAQPPAQATGPQAMVA